MPQVSWAQNLQTLETMQRYLRTPPFLNLESATEPTPLLTMRPRRRNQNV